MLWCGVTICGVQALEEDGGCTWVIAVTTRLRRASLFGRQTDCAALDGLLDRGRGGHSAVLVLRGEAGIGKTALLRYVADRATGFDVARCMGVESEMELAFAGLHD